MAQTTIARVESILPPTIGRYTSRVNVSYRKPAEDEPGDIVAAEEMSPMSFRGVFGGEAKVGDEYRVTTSRVEPGA